MHVNTTFKNTLTKLIFSNLKSLQQNDLPYSTSVFNSKKNLGN